MVWDSFIIALQLFWRRLGLLLTANVLWLSLSIFIIPWPAATAGLFYLVQCVVREELETAPHYARIGDFWEGLRRHGLRCSLLSLINLACILLLVVVLLFYSRSSVDLLRWLVGPVGLMALAWLGSQLYIYPLMLQRPERSTWQVAREAFLIAITYPTFTISLLLTCLVITIAAVALAGPVLLVYFSLMAMLQTIALRVILAQRGEIAHLRPAPDPQNVRQGKR